MSIPFGFLLSVLVASICVAGNAHAVTTVEVLATDPPGEVVTLGRNQNFYLHLGYTTDQPVQIWAHPYFHGKQAAAGTNPSRVYTGSGEALGWFFLMQPGDRIDEVRIVAGDGSYPGTHLVATYPVTVIAGDRPEGAHDSPAWVVELRKQDQAAQQAAYEKRMNTPVTVGDTVLFVGFMLVMLGLGVFGFAAPAWGLWRWRGGWRMAAAVPAVMMAFVVLRLFVETAADPSSHNLWPFEILQVGALSVVIMVALLIARKFTGAGRA
ncbi:MAG TPA: hypothetical protein VFG55_06315 [Rhodanobacteraceae bacterium]|nr:hypothetical protein [Rhodanobacteraceae bacterium]